MEVNTYKGDTMKIVTLSIHSDTKKLLDKISKESDVSRGLIVESLIEALRE